MTPRVLQLLHEAAVRDPAPTSPTPANDTGRRLERAAQAKPPAPRKASAA